MGIDDPKILAIDDNQDDLTVLKAVVHSYLPGATTLTALDGAMGIKMAIAEDPDVILLDIVMPDQDGFEVCRKMKADARLKDIPIVFLTALKPDSASRIKALEAGADGFLAKPLEPAELVAQIRAMAKIKASHQFQRLQKEQLEALVEERTIELKNLLSVTGLMAQEWQTTFDSMDAAIWILDRDRRVLRTNKAAERIFGKPAREMIGALICEIVHGSDLPLHDCPVVRASMTLRRESMEIQLGDRWFEVSVDPILDVSGQAANFVHVATDITGRKLVQLALHERERTLLESQAIARLGSYDLDIPAGRWVASPMLEELFGISPTIDRTVQAWLDIVHPDDRAMMSDYLLNEVIGGQKEFNREYRIIRQTDRTVCWVHGVGRMNFDTQGRPLRMIGSIQDITERKNAEGELERQRNLIDTILSTTSDMIVVKDRASAFQFVNAAFCQFMGKSEAELIGKTDHDLFCHDEAEEYRLGDIEVMTTGKEQRGVWHATAPGGKRWLIGSKAPLCDEKGEISGVLCSLNDFTELKEAELELAASERRFEALAWQTGTVIWEVDAQGLFTFVSEVSEAIWGYRPDEIVGRMHYYDLYPEEGREEFKAAVLAVSERKESFRDLTNLLVRKDGRRLWVLTNASPILAGDGTLIGYRGADVDITEHKRALESLEASERLFRDVFQHSAAVKLMFDPESGRILDANLAAADFYGWPQETLRQMSMQDINVVPFEVIRREVRAALVAGTMTSQFRHRLASGSVRDVQIFGSMHEINGKPAVHAIIFDVTDRLLAEAAGERLRTAIEQADEAIVITDARGTIEYVNPAFEQGTGYTCKEAIGQNPRLLKSGEHDAEFYRTLWRTISSGRTFRCRMVNKRKDGSLYTEDATISPVRDAAGTIVNYVGVKRDVTKQLKLESEFQQAQKMESVGRLAGGIAHDFNNLLMVINGYSQLLKEELTPGDPRLPKVEAILDAGTRAAGLTRQLLTFSRKHLVEPRAIEVDREIGGMRRLMASLLGEDLEVRMALGAPGALIYIDPHQLNQVIMNLAVNSRDAIQGTGSITIETSVVEWGGSRADLHQGVQVSPHVLIEVSDSGVGMSEETRQRIFEPFFTTKPQGKGTGLGLPTVYGIVTQCGGQIEVFSEPNLGTVFRIYLPKWEGHLAAEQPEAPSTGDWGTETVLVVEDEAEALNYVATVLNSHGYRVIAAANAGEALLLAERGNDPIDLLLTDVVMPNLSGPQLVDRLANILPALKVLYMSGYTGDAMTDRGILEEGAKLITKPFRPAELAARVREALGPRKKVRILVADDEAAIRLYFRAVLEAGGYEVVEAGDGRQAISEVRARRVDLALIDLVMPEQEGIETIRALHEQLLGVRIIAVSGGFGANFLPVARLLGADAIMEKPVDPETLLAQVEEVLRLKR
ncbi:MAG: PAS domain S-box protein [Bryobacteraceae bacterium]|nr:PAS domain S-box protein [Bryobacteraceae bacterium]